MSNSVSLFRTEFKGVNIQPSGCMVVKLAAGGIDLDLYFLEASDAAVTLLGYPSGSPVEQVAKLVTSILHAAGFVSYEYELSTQYDSTLHGLPVGEAWFDHPLDPDDAGSTYTTGDASVESLTAAADRHYQDGGCELCQQELAVTTITL